MRLNLSTARHRWMLACAHMCEQSPIWWTIKRNGTTEEPPKKKIFFSRAWNCLTHWDWIFSSKNIYEQNSPLNFVALVPSTDANLAIDSLVFLSSCVRDALANFISMLYVQHVPVDGTPQCLKSASAIDKENTREEFKFSAKRQLCMLATIAIKIVFRQRTNFRLI